MQKGSVNKVILVGHLGGDPEGRFTPGGTAVTTFSIATNESRRNSDGDWDDHTEWHRCVLFGKQAETACLLYTSPSPRDRSLSRMPSSA